MRRFGKTTSILHDNGLSVVLFVLFLGSLIPMSVAGHRRSNEEAREHGGAPQGYFQYLRSDRFLEATMENWESEFLELFVYVVLSIFLRQKGSPESKPVDSPYGDTGE